MYIYLSIYIYRLAPRSQIVVSQNLVGPSNLLKHGRGPFYVFRILVGVPLRTRKREVAMSRHLFGLRG